MALKVKVVAYVARKCLVSVYPHMSVTVYTKADPSSLILGCPSSHPTGASFVPNFSLSVRSSVTQTFAVNILEFYVLHLRFFSDSHPSLLRLRATCLSAMAIYEEKRYCGFFPSGFRTKAVYLFCSSHAFYTLYPFHPASVDCYNAC